MLPIPPSKPARSRPKLLVELLDMADKGALSGPSAKAVFEEMFTSGKKAGDIVAEKGLSQISSHYEIELQVDIALKANVQAVVDYKSGKQQALAFLIGQVMKATKGRANPGMAKEILSRKLGGKPND